jgi:voltage-gated potassium channel
MKERRSQKRDGAFTFASALHSFGQRFLAYGLYVTVLLTCGTLGYQWVEGWEWFDALYMTVTTIFAVGYGEVHPLSGPGRIMTMALIVGGIISIGVLGALITSLLVEIDLRGLFRRLRMVKRIEEMSDHFIVCGTGRMGRVVIREIAALNRPVVGIDCAGEKLRGLSDELPQVLTIEGDATRDQTLNTAGIARARGLAACLPHDADNMFLTLSARGLRPDLEIVTRAYDEESLAKLKRAGATHAIAPVVTGAVRMAATLLRPSVISFLDAATVGTDITLRLEDAEIPAGSPLVGKTLADAKIPQRTGLIVLSLKRQHGGGEATYNPGPETKLSAGDVMVVLGRPEQVQRLREYATAGKE